MRPGVTALSGMASAGVDRALPWAAARRAATAILQLVCLLLVSGVSIEQDPAPTFHRDAQRTGRSDSPGPISPKLLWTFQTQASIDASPVISREGSIYLASTDNGLYALTAAGQLKWRFAARDSIFSTPTLTPEGTVLFADLAGWYYAVDPSGRLKWSYALSGGTAESRVLASAAVAGTGQSYIGAWNDRLFSFGPDGNQLWQLAMGGEGQITASPALDVAGNVYLATLDPLNKNRIAVFKFEPGSRQLWKFTDDLTVDRNRVISSPAIDTISQRLYIGASRSDDGCLYALRLSDGRQVFKAVLPKGIVSSPAIAADGTVYVGCMDGNLYALDGDTGARRWQFSSGAYFVLGSPSIDGFGRVYFGDSDGVVHALTPWGDEIWSYPTQSNIASAPAIGNDGTLYVTSYDSTLYAIGQMPRPRSRR